MPDRVWSFSNGDLRFLARDQGPVGGPPVLLLHGWPQDGSAWAGVTERLNDAGYRTFAPDLRGVDPAAIPLSRRAYSGTELRSDVAAMVAQIGQPVHLVGHDWGAALAWNAATHEPDLLRSLTAISVPHPAAFARSMYTSTQGLKSWYMAFFQLPWVPETALSSNRLMVKALMATGQSREHAQRDSVRNRDHTARRGGLNWYRGALIDAFDAGPPTPVPVLQVWGDQDKAVSYAAIERTQVYAAGAYELKVFAGANHWIPDQAPEQLAEELIAHFSNSRLGPPPTPSRHSRRRNQIGAARPPETD